LIETGEMLLSDGRKIVNSSYNVENEPAEERGRFIKMHPNFRMIILANRPGFPFLGNDFFAILGDLLSCHPVDNPDPQSEIEMLRMYAPNVSEKVTNFEFTYSQLKLLKIAVLGAVFRFGQTKSLYFLTLKKRKKCNVFLKLTNVNLFFL
jgi:hypothetical protein